MRHSFISIILIKQMPENSKVLLNFFPNHNLTHKLPKNDMRFFQICRYNNLIDKLSKNNVNSRTYPQIKTCHICLR